ncbi:MAG TPA: hypothetical protein VGZ90_10055 [Puia sp.]|nr:hypothetical protein [Puia sp.]
MHSSLKCTICGFPLYNTDQCISEFIYHCSSEAARFWDYDRGSIDQIKAKEHWDQSMQEIPNSSNN